MAKVAFVFPGQGSQYVGMAKDLYENRSEVKELFDEADNLFGFSISKICFEGPEESLKQTRITQPAIFLHSMAVFLLLKDYPFQMVAGHSLGEYSALVAAGILKLEDALNLVRLRGELMQKAGLENPGTMAAIIGLENKVVEAICEESSKSGIVQIANLNSPGQIVISGSVDAVRKAMELAREKGARIVKELSVSGAFHSPLMGPAESELGKAIEKVDFKTPEVAIYLNVTAKPASSPSQIKNMILRQLTSPVKWEESIRNMINDGATTFIEIGPGKVLQGLIKRIEQKVEVLGCDTLRDLVELEKKLVNV